MISCVRCFKGQHSLVSSGWCSRWNRFQSDQRTHLHILTYREPGRTACKSLLEKLRKNQKNSVFCIFIQFDDIGHILLTARKQGGLRVWTGAGISSTIQKVSWDYYLKFKYIKRLFFISNWIDCYGKARISSLPTNLDAVYVSPPCASCGKNPVIFSKNQ